MIPREYPINWWNVVGLVSYMSFIIIVGEAPLHGILRIIGWVCGMITLFCLMGGIKNDF